MTIWYMPPPVAPLSQSDWIVDYSIPKLQHQLVKYCYPKLKKNGFTIEEACFYLGWSRKKFREVALRIEHRYNVSIYE